MAIRKNKKVGLVLLGCGVWRNLKGKKGERAKNMIRLQTFPPNPCFLVFVFLPSISYRALNASNHRLYAVSISNETLGLRSSRICRKSTIVSMRGLASLFIA